MAHANAGPSGRVRWFVPGDWDCFFALFFSGFPDLLLIAGLAPLCGFPPSTVTTRILPGVALSILAGNIFYSWQAHRLTERTGREPCLASGRFCVIPERDRADRRSFL